MDDLLNKLAAGELDALSPEEVAALAAHLDANPAAADRVAGLTPPIEPALQADVPLPGEEAWGQVWAGIEAGRRTGSQPFVRRVLRIVEPVLALAACVLMAVIWNAGEQQATAAWPVEWATTVEIDEIEVADGSVPYVAAVEGDESTVSVVWVLDLGES
ncbi:MAG: hypothetical protein PVJ57_22370 [Phycisphaerae bacterium]|jgi:hypothetical protein